MKYSDYLDDQMHYHEGYILKYLEHGPNFSAVSPYSLKYGRSCLCSSFLQGKYAVKSVTFQGLILRCFCSTQGEGMMQVYYKIG